MISHSSYYSRLSSFFNLLGLNVSKIEVIALGLLPDIMWSVISGP